MSLSDLWLTSRAQLEDKQVHQIIAFAGTGQLNDGGPASREFREFLSLVPSAILERYADECLRECFPSSGFAFMLVHLSHVRIVLTRFLATDRLALPAAQLIQDGRLTTPVRVFA